MTHNHESGTPTSGFEPKEREVSSEQYQALYEQVLAWAEARVAPEDFTDQMPEGDTPAKLYRIPVPEEQAKQVFKVPRGIAHLNPHDFNLTVITPHRFETGDTPKAILSASYSFSDRRSTTYFASQHQVGDTLQWSGMYMQEEAPNSGDGDEFIEDDEHEMKSNDFNTLNAIVAYATQS